MTESRTEENRTGFDDFIDTVKRFRSLSLSMLGGGLVIPYLAYVSNIMPPLHGAAPGLLAALVELVTLTMVFQLYRKKPKRVIDALIFRGVILLFASSALYLVTFIMLTFSKGQLGVRGVRGFICKKTGLSREQINECPFVSRITLANSEWDSYQVWQDWTVDLNLSILMLNWLASFFFLSFVAGVFLVYQTRIAGSAPPLQRSR